MATKLIGTDTAGDTNCSTGYVEGSQFTCAVSGTLDTIKVYCLVNSNVRVAIYTDSGSNTVGNLIAESASTAVTKDDWRSIAIAGGAIVAGTKYWLMAQCETTGGTSYRSLAGALDSWKAQAYGAFPANGTGFSSPSAYEYASQGWGEEVIPKTSSDTGSGADAKVTGNPVATQVRAETGAGADAKSSNNPLGFLVKTEAGSGAEALVALLNILIRAETGSGIESLLDRDLILTELGSGLDAVVVLVQSEKITSDSGVGTESLGDRVIALSSESGSGLEVVAQFLRFLNDAGSASEALSIIAAAIIKADVGSGGEEINISATLLAQIETATGIDASTLLAAFLKAETGSGTEELSQIITSIQGSDLGSGLETFISLLANIWLYLGDSGVGTEQILDRAMVLISEAGLGADASVLLAGMTADDVAAAIDASIAIVAALQRTEAGKGVDAAVDLLGILSASDIGTGTELSVLLAALIVSQSGIGTDAMLSLLAVLTKTDVGSGIDATVELLTTRILSVAVITKAYRNVKAITYGG